MTIRRPSEFPTQRGDYVVWYVGSEGQPSVVYFDGAYWPRGALAGWMGPLPRIRADVR